MVSIRYEFGIIIRSDSIRDLLDEIEPAGSSSDPVLNQVQTDQNFLETRPTREPVGITDPEL